MRDGLHTRGGKDKQSVMDALTEDEGDDDKGKGCCMPCYVKGWNERAEIKREG